MFKRITIILALSLCVAAGASAQNHNTGAAAASQADAIRAAAVADWNVASGLDGLYRTSPGASTPAPKGYEAVYISHYGRHGSRYAYTEKTYSTIFNMLSEALGQDNLTAFGESLLQQAIPFWEHAKYRVGDLTPRGWEQHQYIAGRMVKDYPVAFGKGSKVDACSSPSVRSIISMSSFCAAVSRLAPAAEVYEHQGIMDVQATRPNAGRNPFRYQGPALKFPYPESSEGFFYRRLPGYKEIMGRIFKDPDKAFGAVNPYDTFFYLYMLVAGMNSLPDDVRMDLSGTLTPEEFATLWEIDNYERFREYLPYRTPCFSIVDDMVAKADSVLAAGGRGAHLRFGHDHVLMSLLMAMDLDGSGTIPDDADDLILHFNTSRSPMAANIQMVFYRPKKKNVTGPILVKFLLNGDEVPLGDITPATGPYYDWEQVKAFLDARRSLFVLRPIEEGWTSEAVAPGLVYKHFSGTEPVSGSAQQVFVADWDMSVPGLRLKFTNSFPDAVTSDVMQRYGAVVAMNAAYERSSIVIRIDGKDISMMPNPNVMTTGVPNWKNEGSVSISSDGKVSISWDGKGRDILELREFYSTSTATDIFSSAPMLIADFVPAGESFAGFYGDDAINSFKYEDLRRHQGVRHPRTAVAITADNHFLMIVVDGRSPGISEGMTSKELTRFLRKNFNPRWALNMDGGGSSTLCIEGKGDPATHVVNYPSGNKRHDHAGQRSVGTHFCLVREP